MKLLQSVMTLFRRRSPMNEIEQYRPGFFDGFENKVIKFSSVGELEKIPFVSSFAALDGFCGFAIGGNKLMAVYDGGCEWWVVGTLKKPDGVDLPKWTPGANPSQQKG